jgi:hypothetical protein
MEGHIIIGKLNYIFAGKIKLSPLICMNIYDDVEADDVQLKIYPCYSANQSEKG